MSKEAVFTMKLEPELRAAFMAEAEALDRPASQVVRELMREFIQRQQESRAYDAFVAEKVQAATTPRWKRNSPLAAPRCGRAHEGSVDAARRA